MSWRPTNAAWGMLGGAVVLFAAASAVAIGGVRSYLRASSLEEALHMFARTPEPGAGGLEAVNTALDRAPDDATLLLMKATMLATKERELERSGEVFSQLAKGASSSDPERKRVAALARIGAAVTSLERARRSPEGKAAGAAAARKESIAEALEAAEAAAKALPKRAEPKALLAAALLESGDLARAQAAIAEAQAATEPPTRGGLLTLYAAEAEAARRGGDFEGEAQALMRAVALAPPSAKTGTEAGSLAFDLRPRLVRALARRTLAPRVDDGVGRMVAASPTSDAARAAVDATRALLVPILPLERYRKSMLLGLDPHRATLAREAIAVAEARRGDLEGARRTLEEALKDAQQDPGLLRQLAAVHALACKAEANPAVRKGLARKASDAILDAADKAKATGPEGRDLFLVAAVHARDADMLEQATRLAERAAKCLEGGAGDVRIDRLQGVVFDQWGRHKSALESYRRALAGAPSDPDAAAIEARIAVLEAKLR